MLEWVEQYGSVLEPAGSVAAVVAGLWWLASNRPRTSDTGEPLCGRCGYNVTGLPSKRCPECGSDLDLVGVDRGQRARRYWRAAVLWSVAGWLILGYGAAAIYQRLKPALPRYEDRLEVRELGGPASRAYTEVSIRCAWRGLTSGQKTLPRSISLSIAGDGGVIDRPMAVEPATLRYRFRDGAGADRQGVLDAASMLAWMRSCGVSGEAALLDAEAKEILRHVEVAVLRTGRAPPPAFANPFRWGGYSTRNSGGDPISPRLALLAAVFLSWAAGVWVIARGLRKPHSSASKP